MTLSTVTPAENQEQGPDRLLPGLDKAHSEERDGAVDDSCIVTPRLRWQNSTAPNRFPSKQPSQRSGREKPCPYGRPRSRCLHRRRRLKNRQADALIELARLRGFLPF